jgi:type IV secretory pathway TraG/TraD family ATPase VirD4
MQYQGSCICIDPKGENAAICAAELMRQGAKDLQINPYNILPEALSHIPSICYNPLVTLNPRSIGSGSDCDALGPFATGRQEKMPPTSPIAQGKPYPA